MWRSARYGSYSLLAVKTAVTWLSPESRLSRNTPEDLISVVTVNHCLTAWTGASHKQIGDNRCRSWIWHHRSVRHRLWKEEMITHHPEDRRMSRVQMEIDEQSTGGDRWTKCKVQEIDEQSTVGDRWTKCKRSMNRVQEIDEQSTGGNRRGRKTGTDWNCQTTTNVAWEDYFWNSFQAWNWSLVYWIWTIETRLLHEIQYL